MTSQQCKVCMSADTSLQRFMEGLDVETSHHRVNDQQNKCTFGLQGVCCKLCSNGPCRITPKAPRGVCGATADTIVARNFLRAVAAGTGCYIHVLETAAQTLKETCLVKGELKGEAALRRLSEVFGLDAGDAHERGLQIANAILADLYKPSFEKMELVEKLSYKPRFEVWKKLGILPGGAKSEVFDGIVKTSTNLNSDPVNMLLDCLTLGITTGLYGLVLTNLVNDILLGDPAIRIAPVGFRVVNESYINIMLTGHQHAIFAHLQERLMAPDVTARAKAVGAEGFRLVGCTCVGQDLQLRGEHYRDVFVGHAGNNFTSEALIATGGIDSIISEFNCTLPGIEPIADRYNVKMLCLDDLAKKANADFLAYSFAEREVISESIITESIRSFQNRRGSIPINLPAEHGHDDCVTGLSETSLKQFLGGTWQPLIELIAQGKIKGLAGVVGCSNLTAKGHDVFTVELTKELIKRNILVLSAGCSSGGLENVGLMSPGAAALAGDSLRAVCESLGIPPVLNFGPCLAIGRLELIAGEIAGMLDVDIPQLPLVLSAPQWLEEQALADGSFGLALGLPLHLSQPPFVTGSPVVSEVLTKQLVDLTGGQIILEGDVQKAADALEAIIEQRRTGLGLA